MSTTYTTSLIGGNDLNIGNGNFTDAAGTSHPKINARTFNTQIFNIMDYGATTSASDNSTAIQDAITAAELVRGVVYIPGASSDYAYSTELQLAQNTYVSMFGDGPRQSVLSYNGSGNGLTLTGGTTGTNQGIYLGNFQINDNGGNGLIGFNIGNCSFSPVFERLMVTGFTDKCFYFAHPENGILIGCFAEMSSTAGYGFYFANANGVSCYGIQSHGKGSFNGTDGSIGFYADNIDDLYVDGTFEGGGTGASPENADIAIYLQESADRATPNGGAFIKAYIERVVTGVKCRGFDSDTWLQFVELRGKITGNVTTGYVLENYVRHFNARGLRNAATTPYTADSTCQNHDPGRQDYTSTVTDTVTDNSTFPPIKESTWYFGTATEIYNATGLTSTVSATEATIGTIAGDYRRPLAVELTVKITADTVGSGASCHVAVRPNGGGDTTNHRVYAHKAALANADIVQSTITVPVDSSGKIQYSVTIGTGWTVDVLITQIGVMY